MALTVGHVPNAEMIYETGKPQKGKNRTLGVQQPTGNTGDSYEPQTVRFDKKGYPVPYGETLTLTPEEKFFFGAYTRKAEYTYTANGRETIAQIQAKFHLKDGAIEKCNNYIKTNTNIPDPKKYVPEKGRKIYFYQEDVIVK